MAPTSEPKSMSPLNRKNQPNASPIAPNWVQGVQVGSKNRSNIDRKMESKMECILASIFERFCWILGAKLGGKIDQKSIKNHMEKTMQKTKPFGTRLGPSSGCQGGRDVLRPNPARPGATRTENPFPGAARAARLAQEYQLKTTRRQSYVF